jgi:type IV pilus modification protein PilV
MGKNMAGPRRGLGFSLIEILIAVVVLATGLLALTALQGRLAQASSEAKTRSRVASMLASRLDELRAGQYDNAALDVGSDGTASNTFNCVSNVPTWLCTAQSESAVTGLSVGQQVSRYLGTTGSSGSFTVSSAAAATVSTPEFKRIVLTATWDDASGGGHRLSVSTDISPLSLRSSLIPKQPGGAGSGGNPIVRQDTPATDGVIPLTVGNEATAASNPRPEILEGHGNNRDIVGTRFDVLTYSGNTGEAVIQRRVETSVIKCTCSYGAGGAANLGEIYAEPQWPVTWDGTKYRLVKSAEDAEAPGVSENAGPADVDQSALCTECCRDHHDKAGMSADESFDPERLDKTGVVPYVKYNALGVVAVGQYVNACRLVRVDGFWRTASDMYSRHFALLPTKAKAPSTNPATSGLPQDAAVTTYETFVKEYLGGITGAAATPPSNADTLFSGTAYASIQQTSPEAIGLEASPDVRYLHARGLYIDNLGPDARDMLVKALANKPKYCPDADSDAECVLLYLPLSTVNLTEIANWSARTSASPSSATSNTISVSNDRAGTQIWDPVEPTRSSTMIDDGEDGDHAFAVSVIGQSNAGVAVADEVDPYDGPKLSDAQKFSIGSTVTDSGHNFWISATGLNSFGVSWDNGACTGAGTTKKCLGLSDGNAHSVTLTFGAYNYLGTAATITNPCNANKTTSRPQYYNHAMAVSYEACSVAEVAGIPVEVPLTCSSGTIVPVEANNPNKAETTGIASFTVQENKIYKFSFTSVLTPVDQVGGYPNGTNNVGCQGNTPQWLMLDY